MKRCLSLLLAACTLHAYAEPPRIGRLFTTPAERERLDALRQSGGQSPVAAQPAPVEEVQPPAPPPPPPEPMVVTGIVTRSDGKSVVWINDTPQPDQTVTRSAGRTPAAVVTLPSGQRATIKAGQALDVTTGAVGDAPRR